MIDINIELYGIAHKNYRGLFYFETNAEGRQAAKDCNLKDHLLAGKVNLVFQDGYIQRTYITSRLSSTWVAGFIGPIMRQIDSQIIRNNLYVNGVMVFSESRSSAVALFHSYILKEEKRQRKVVLEKKRQTDDVWSEPIQMIIPEIGTILKLTDDWEFVLYHEHRNNKLLELINEKGKWYNADKSTVAIIKAGSMLTIDRIYIRKGSGEYSSVTFHLRKGGRIDFSGKEYKATGRFWVKLKDTNKLKVVYDLNTINGIE